jgi:choline monooxygenase
VTTTLPASWYSDPGIWERERHGVFGSEWVLVARRSQLHEVGRYVATEVGGYPIVVVAQGDGVLRAFHNVCRHRAGPLVYDGEGELRSFVCRYHGWAYDLDGRLLSARDFGGDPDLEPDCLGLLAVRVDEWAGLVFVNLAVEGEALRPSLAGFADVAEEFELGDFSFTEEVVHRVDCNWKTYAENYLEGYHIPLVHPELNREIDAKRYRVDVDDRWVLHSAPTRDGVPTAGRWLWRYPNLALNVYPTGMNVERFVPDGPRRTKVVYWYFFRDGAQDPEAVRLSSALLDEDRRICEAVQRNLEAGVYESGRLSPRHEAGVARFQQLVRDAVEGQEPAESRFSKSSASELMQ